MDNNANDKLNSITALDVENTPKKRGRKPKSDSEKKKNYYFDSFEEEAFRKYIETTDPFEKRGIFNNILYPALSKMVECIIRRYNLSTPNEEYENTFNDVLSFLITKVNHFKPSKNKKAYSYCGTICKNYLVLKMSNYTRKDSKLSSYENIYNDRNPDTRISDQHENEVQSFNRELISVLGDKLQAYLERKTTLTDNERKVGNALRELLLHWEEVFDNFDGDETKKYNKTNVLYYLKENTLLTTKEVRKAMKKYKELYKNIKVRFIEFHS